jgi:hypothetical protein
MQQSSHMMTTAAKATVQSVAQTPHILKSLQKIWDTGKTNAASATDA